MVEAQWSPTCMLCQACDPGIWLYVEYRPGDVFAVPQSSPLCLDCHRLLTAHEDAALLERMPDPTELEQYGASNVFDRIRDRGRLQPVLDGWPGGRRRGSLLLVVDDELFAVEPGDEGGTSYAWLTGPNEGYGFSSSGGADQPIEEHRSCIRAFLSQVDRESGYIE